MSRRLITTLSPEAKMYGKLYYMDLMIIGSGIAIVMLTHELIHYMVLKMIYATLVLMLSVWLSYRPQHNPKKRNYEVVQFAWKRDRATYHMLLPSELTRDDVDEESFIHDSVIDLTMLET